MMYVEIDGAEFELQTNLLVIKRIEEKLGVAIMSAFSKLGEATCKELMTIIMCGFPPNEKGRAAAAEFEKMADKNWGLIDPLVCAQEMVSRLMFTGTDEQKEAKMSNLNLPEERKNALRELFGMKAPEDEDLTGG